MKTNPIYRNNDDAKCTYQPPKLKPLLVLEQISE